MSPFTPLLTDLGREYDPLLANELTHEVCWEVSRRISSIISFFYKKAHREGQNGKNVRPWWCFWSAGFGTLCRVFLLSEITNYSYCLLFKPFWPGLSITFSQKDPIQCTGNQVQPSRDSCRVFFRWKPKKFKYHANFLVCEVIKVCHEN